MKRSSERIDRLTVKEITLESKNGSVTLSANNNDGKIRFEPLNKTESGSFVVDLKNENITTENVFIKKINFYDGTYLDSAALISEAIGIVNEGLKTIELKPNKIFFKYNGDNTPGAGQQIEIKVIKPSSLTGTPILTIAPNNVGITLNQTAPDTYILTVAEFNKASADTIQIQATLTNAEGIFTDILTIFKTRDGTDALVGGLSNPFLALQANSAGQVTDLATILSSKAIGTFTVFKGSDDLTNSGKVTYSVQSVTDNLIASINPTTGIYAITNWSPDELTGEAIFTATDNITNQQVKGKFTIITSKQGQDGLTGTGARTVKLIADDQQIAYKADDELLAPTSIQITASQQNHVGTVYYEFIVYDGLSNIGITLYNGTNDNILLTNTNKNYGSATYTFIENTKTGYGKSKTLKVRTRENSPSAPIISSEDVISIIATRDGSDAFEVVFSNTNHSFPANSSGEVALESYAGGGSIVEAYIGNEQLSPVLNTPGNGQFTVSVSEQQNITSGLIVPEPNSAIKRMNIGDPSNFISNKDSGSITYTITGKGSNGVSKTQLEKVSFTKSKQGTQGLPGSSGTDARAVELVSDIYQFNYNSSNTASPVNGFTLTVSPKNVTGTVSYKFYKNNVLVVTQTQTTLTRTDIPAANNSDSWKVELLEDNIIKATDTVSIYGTKDGSDAITLIVPNDNHTFTADNTGGSINFAGSETTIKMFIGSTLLNATTSSPLSSGQFSAFVSNISGITIGTITVTDINTLTLGPATAFDGDTGIATLTVEFIRPGSTTKETVTKVLTYSKSKQGLQGQNGSSGIDARAVELVSNLYQFNYNSSNIASPASGFTLTASPKNTTGTVSYKFYKNNVLITTQSETILARTDIPIANNSDSWKVELLEDGTVKAVDTVSIYGTKDGSDSITLVVPNDNHTFTADNSGGSINFAGSGTTIKLIVGSTALTATTSSPPSSGQFNASLSGVSGISLGSITVTDTNTLTLGPATAFGSDTGTATLTVNFLRPGSTTTEAVTRTLTYSKSKQGQQGLPGSSGVDARAVELVSNVYQFNYNSSNTASPSGGFTLTASAKNTTGTVTYRFYKNNILITTQAATTLARTDIPTINNSDSWKVEMLEDGIVKAIDTLSLYGTKDGSDAITLIVPNDNHTFTADSAGGSINFAGSGTTIKILVGSTFLNATTSSPPSSGQFNASLSGVAGITLGSITVTAADTLTLGQATAFGSDSGTATLTVNFRRPGSTTTETVTRTLTYSKSKQGTQGLPGSRGDNARAVELSATRYQVPYNNGNPSTTNIDSITLTATPRNVTGAVTYRFLIDNTQVQAASATTTFVVSGINLPTANSTKTCRVEMLEEGTLVAIDTISLVGTKDGSDAVTIEMPNNNHTFTCDVNGTPQTFNGSGTTVRVFVGNTALTATNSAPTAGQFKVSASSISPANSITVPTPTVSSTTATIGNLSNFTADSATVTYTIDFRRPNSTTTETLTQIGTYSKSKTGQVGPDGPRGATGATGATGANGIDGVDAADELIYSFNRTKTVNSIIRPIGWLSVSADNSTHEQYQLITNYYSTIGRVVASGESIYGGNIFALEQSSGDFSTPRYIASPSVPIDPKKSYKIKVRFKWTTGLNTNSRIYFNNFNGNFVRTKQYYCDIDSVITSNNWVELNFYFSDSTTDASTVSNINTATTVLPFYQNTAFFNFVIYTDSMSGGGSVYFDILSITEWTLNDKDTFWFTTDGKLRIGLNRSGTVRADDGNLFNYLSDTPDIQIIAGSTTSNIFDGGFPDINMTNPSYQSNILGKLSFNGANGVIYDNNSNATLEIPPDQIEIAERSSIIVGQRSYSGLVGRPYIALYNAPPTGLSVHPVVTARAVPQLNMFIENACVGIPNLPFASGVPDYTHRLYVDGKAHITGGIKTNLFDNTQGYTFIGGTSTAVAGALYVNRGSATSQITTTQDEFYIDAATGGTGLYLNAKVAKNVILGSGGGNVGIGAVTPAGKLHIKQEADNTYLAGLVIEENSSTARWGIALDDVLPAEGGVNSSDNRLMFYYDIGNDSVNNTYTSGIKAVINPTSTGGNVNFTGQHRNISDNINLYSSSYVGLIVTSCGIYAPLSGNLISINESLPKVALSSKRNEKSVFGVISDSEDPLSTQRTYEIGNFVSFSDKKQDDTRLIINSLGEGAIWVCNINGDLENGDYITTCEIPGYGMKQDDDLLHNYTVAKITCDCEFDLNSPIYICEEFEFEGKTYKKAFVGCTYHCG